MIFLEFKRLFFPQRVFSTVDIAKEMPGFYVGNLLNWQKKGYIVKLRNNWYAFPDALNAEADLYVIANRLQRPSYVSLETALRYYNFIPESVFSITSVTTLKPVAWPTPVGNFSYRSLQPKLFFGYDTVQVGAVNFNIASPEKCLLDLLYFSPNLIATPDFEVLRLNQAEIVKRVEYSTLEKFLARIDSAALNARCAALQHYLTL